MTNILKWNLIDMDKITLIMSDKLNFLFSQKTLIILSEFFLCSEFRLTGKG